MRRPTALALVASMSLGLACGGEAPADGSTPDGSVDAAIGDAAIDDAAAAVDAGPPPVYVPPAPPAWNPRGWDLDATVPEPFCSPYAGSLEALDIVVRDDGVFVLEVIFNNTFAFTGPQGPSGSSLQALGEGGWRDWWALDGDPGPLVISENRTGAAWLPGRVGYQQPCGLFELAGPDDAHCALAEQSLVDALPDGAGDGAGWLLGDRELTRRDADGRDRQMFTLPIGDAAFGLHAAADRIYLHSVSGVWAGAAEVPFEPLFEVAEERRYLAMTVDDEGDVWLTTFDRRLLRLDPDGTLRSEVTLPGFGRAVWVNPAGMPYVITEHHFARVVDGEVEVLAEFDPEWSDGYQYFRTLAGDPASGAVYLGISDSALALYACGSGVIVRYDEAGFTRL